VLLGAAPTLLLLVAARPASGDGFRNTFQGAAAIAQGNAFAAQADDPSAVHYNPAGMTQLRGAQVSSGVGLVNVDTRFSSPTGATTENDLGGPVGLPPPGQLFLTANLGDLGARALGRLTVGLGVESLFGFASRYPDDGPFATAVTSARLPLLDIKPTLAYPVTEALALGLGADILTFAPFVGGGEFRQRFVWPGGLGIPAGARVEINGAGTTVGLNAGLLATLWRGATGRPRLNIAAVWRSQAVLPLEGDFLVDGQRIAGASAKFRFPASSTTGLAVWPLRNPAREWKLEVDLDYVWWSAVRDFDVGLSDGRVLRNPQDWRDAVTVGLGTEYRWVDPPVLRAWEVALRGGYLRSMTPIPDVNFNPVVPDADVNVWSVGLGLLCKPGGTFLGLVSCGREREGGASRSAIGLDLAYHILLFEPRTVTGAPNPAVNGTYRTTNQALALMLHLRF
jgi:long-chain fatty acid transport protein